MLKCVVFPVTAYGYRILVSEGNRIKEVLAEESVCLEVMRVDGEQELICFLENTAYQKEEMLFVTDNERLLQILLSKEYYAIAFYHEKNRNVFFAGALYAVEDIAQLTFSPYDEAYRRLANIPWDILETERLWVRESTVEDVADFYRIYAEPSITCYMEDLFQDPDEERAYMETYIKQFYGFYGFGMWTVLLKETGQIIGRAGLSVREGHELPELGFVIDVAFQRKGLAYEVCRAILQYAKEELFFDKVQALAEPDNQASLRLLEKLGFVWQRRVVEAGRKYELFIKDLTARIYMRKSG